VSVALVERTGPWTPDDVEALPDLGDHARFEVYEGGVLVVSPAPGVPHQRASYRLHRYLASAAAVAGGDFDVLEQSMSSFQAASCWYRTLWSWLPKQPIRRQPGLRMMPSWPW
jgi:hypothetical protein